MFSVAAVVALTLGVLSLAVAAIGIRNGVFPFRPRNSGAGPDGNRHKLRRADEPLLFWVAASGLLCAGMVMLVMAGSLALKLVRSGA